MSEAKAIHRDSPRRLTTVIAADICGYSRIAEVDQAAAVRTVEIVYAAFENTVTAHRGRVFHRAGDGFLAEFPSAVDGVLAALDFVADIKARDNLSPNNPAARVRVGVHVGDVADQADGDLLGHGVNVAARLQGEANANGVLVSIHAVNLVRDKVDVYFRRRGPLALKNIDEPIVAFEAVRAQAGAVRWSGLLRPLRPLRTNAFAIVIMALVLFSVNFLLWDRLTHRRELPEDYYISTRLTNERLSAAAENITQRKGAPLDERAIRMILQRLATSDQPIDKLVFSLIEQNNLDRAIVELEAQYSKSVASMSDQERLQGLLQMGALSFEAKPQKAKAYYQEAVDIDPENFEAHKRLGRLLMKQSQIAAARSHFNAATVIGSASKEEILLLEDHLAYSFLHERKTEEAINRYRDLLDRAKKLNSPIAVSRIQTNLGIAHVMAGNYAAAKDTLVPAMALQERSGYDDELARALSAMATIAQLEGGLDEAAIYYQRAYEVEKALGRISGVSQNLLSLARIDLERGALREAELKYAEALRFARENNLQNSIIFSLVGQAAVDARNGEAARACAHLAAAERTDAGETSYGRFSRQVIAETGCGFKPLGVLPAAGEPAEQRAR